MVDINLLPKEYRKKKEGLKTIFSKTGGMVLVLLILAFALYGGVLFYKNKLTQNLNIIEEKVTELDQKRDPEMEQIITGLNKQLGTLENLFKEHLYWSRLFGKIEELVVPRVYFSEAKLTLTEDKVNVVLSGNALTYTVLAQQMASFQDESLIKKIEISSISLSTEGGIDFDLAITFSKDALLM